MCNACKSMQKAELLKCSEKTFFLSFYIWQVSKWHVLQDFTLIVTVLCRKVFTALGRLFLKIFAKQTTFSSVPLSRSELQNVQLCKGKDVRQRVIIQELHGCSSIGPVLGPRAMQCHKANWGPYCFWNTIKVNTE